MMRAVLLVALIGAFIAIQSVSAGTTIYTQSYADPATTTAANYLCGGELSEIVGVNRTSGECVDTVGVSTNTSNVYWVDAGCTTFYQHNYDGLGCVPANLKQIAATPTACGAVGTFKQFNQAMKCEVNGTASAAAPTYPPAGFKVDTTTGWNNTYNEVRTSSEKTCGAASFTTQLAVNSCGKVLSSAGTTAGSLQSTCKNGISYSATYLSQSCSGSPVQVIVSPFVPSVCSDGKQASTCVDNGIEIPSFPAQALDQNVYAAVTVYTNSVTCNITLASTYVKTYYSKDCFNAATRVCSGNSTGGYTLTQNTFTAVDNGQCTTSTGSTSYADKQCVSSGSTSTQYTCEALPSNPQDGAASSASASIVTFLIAVFVAIVASRH